ncbi:MAG: hypothetical protein WC700_02745 [Gemmatimonadaceae bacterium]|jgi:carboxypeptidase C (cathepsin A)
MRIPLLIGAASIAALATLATAQRPDRPATAAAQPNATAQPAAARPTPKSEPDASLKFPADSTVRREGAVTIKGQRVPYRVTIGNQPVWDDKGAPIATLFHTYYERTDVADRSTRPLVISFNGGPGSASVWMHVAYTGPKLLHRQRRLSSAALRRPGQSPLDP